MLFKPFAAIKIPYRMVCNLRGLVTATETFLAIVLGFVLTFGIASAWGDEANIDEETVRSLIGWGWEDHPHGQTLASDVLGQHVGGDPSRPHFGSHGPYGGATPHGFFFYGFNSGRYQTLSGMAAHLATRTLAVPDYWNHRVLLFDLNQDGSLASRTARRLIGQSRFDEMELGQGANRLHFPSSCTFDPAGRMLFVADEYNHRVLQFDMNSPARAVRVYGQGEFQSWGPDSSPGALIWDSTRTDIRGPELNRQPHARGLFLPRGVACDGRRLFVSDCDNHRVLVFETGGTGNGPPATAVLGQADFSGFRPNRDGERGAETMLFPSGLALSADARYLLVADSMNARLLAFDIAGEIRNGMPAAAILPLLGTEQSRPTSQPKRREITGVVDVAVDEANRVFLSDRSGMRVLVYRLENILAGDTRPSAAVGKFEMGTDLKQSKPGYVGPTGLALAGDFLYVAEPRANRVLCFDASNLQGRACNLLGQFYGTDRARVDYNKYGPNNGPDPYGFDFADGSPALSVSPDGAWLLAADPIGGRLLFFPLGADGLSVDRSARFALGTPTLTARANNYGSKRFNRPSHSVLTAEGRLFASDFQGSRILHFELPDFVAAVGAKALAPLRPFLPPIGRKPGYREWFEFRSIESGVAALHVLGQPDFETGLRGVATRQQMGKEMSGLAFDRDRQWLIVTEKLNHRVLLVDVSRGVETFMPAMAVLGQRDFEQNTPYGGQAAWHPAGMREPSGACYDHSSKMLFVASGEGMNEREILGFDLSGKVSNGMLPCLRIGGPHATIKSDLPYVSRTLAIDEERRRLWSGLFAIDLSGDFRTSAPVIGWFGLGPHDQAANLQGYHTGPLPNLLGYSVGFCHRFGGGIHATAVNPRTGTVYVADSARYRVLAFQPEFHFHSKPLTAFIGRRTAGLSGTGGLAPLEFTVEKEGLPNGLVIDSQTGLITGIADDQPGEYRVPVQVQTALGTVRGAVRVQLYEP